MYSSSGANLSVLNDIDFFVLSLQWLNKSWYKLVFSTTEPSNIDCPNLTKPNQEGWSYPLFTLTYARLATTTLDNLTQPIQIKNHLCQGQIRDICVQNKFSYFRTLKLCHTSSAFYRPKLVHTTFFRWMPPRVNILFD